MYVGRAPSPAPDPPVGPSPQNTNTIPLRYKREVFSRPPLTRASLKPLFTILGWMALWAVILFACAGNLEWSRGRLYVVLVTCGVTSNWLIVSLNNPGLFAERAKKHAGTKRFDKFFGPLFTVLSFALLIVAGLEERFHAPATGPILALLGAVFYLVGLAPMTWAMAVNPHLERTVRIQTDRGHRVISVGPYRIVRHPMYAGLIVSTLSAPLIFGSPWTWLPSGLLAVLMIWRTALEDRTLRAELAGYEDYARRTRYRLVPGLW